MAKVDMGRRRLLIGAVGIAATTATVFGTDILTQPGKPAEVIDTLRFLIERNSKKTERQVYLPENPHLMLEREDSDKLFDSLQLEQRYPGTINKESFFFVSQRVARLANLFFKKEDKPNSQCKPDFLEHCKNFFGQMQQVSHGLGSNFIGVMLMHQVSGDPNANNNQYKRDILEERARVGISLLQSSRLLGSAPVDTVIDILRQVEILPPSYYGMPRLEGNTTLGIHDIENWVTTRAVSSIPKNDKTAWFWNSISNSAPNFVAQIEPNNHEFKKLEDISNEIKEKASTPEWQKFCDEYFSDPSIINSFISTDGTVDTYQFKRTTTFWTKINQLYIEKQIGMSMGTHYENELYALRQAVSEYKTKPKGYFLMEQMCSPKMQAFLKQKSESGDGIASKIWQLSKDLHQQSEIVITQDRKVAKTLVENGLEDNMQFQILTGVAIAMHFQRDTGITTDTLNPNSIAYQSFVGSALRENPSNPQLNDRPLEKATTNYSYGADTRKLLQNFVDSVCKPCDIPSPEENFEVFLKYFKIMTQSALSQQLTLGVPLDEIGADKTTKDFLKLCKEKDIFMQFMAAPHNSWIRALEAVSAYIVKVKE